MNLLDEYSFWFGLFYVCFPLNFMVYGWNDMADYEVDQCNPRKDSFLFGAKGTKEQLSELPPWIAGSQLFLLPLLFSENGLYILLLFLMFCACNFLYNKEKNGWRTRPPLELFIQFAYVLVVPMSILINDATAVSWAAYAYLGLFSMQSHLIGEVMDIEADKKGGRQTTATVIGIKKTKLLIILVVLLETVLLLFHFKDYIFGGMLVLAFIWLLLDLFLIYKTRIYTLNQMKLFALLSNVLALLSMGYVWYSGCLG